MFNTALVLHEAALFGGFSAACRDGRFVRVCFCEAVLEASLWDLLSSITITISISICHSTDEEIIGFENLPQPSTIPLYVKFWSNEIGLLNSLVRHDVSLDFILSQCKVGVDKPSSTECSIIMDFM
jgi:hypothetical protein